MKNYTNYKTHWETYSHPRCTDENRIDPVALVGGELETISKRQLDVLKLLDLLPSHKYLDIGCGCVRGSRLIEKYLNEGNYWGLDISETLLEEGRKHVRVPSQLILIKDNNYSYYVPLQFDYIILFSVFTHVYSEDVVDMLNNIKPILKKDGKCIASVLLCDADYTYDFKGDVGKMHYKKEYIENLFTNSGYTVDSIKSTITNTLQHKLYILKHGLY